LLFPFEVNVLCSEWGHLAMTTWQSQLEPGLGLDLLPISRALTILKQAGSRALGSHLTVAHPLRSTASLCQGEVVLESPVFSPLGVALTWTMCPLLR
jgi:hypothetical protein